MIIIAYSDALKQGEFTEESVIGEGNVIPESFFNMMYSYKIFLSAYSTHTHTHTQREREIHTHTH